ncbi:MAG TPA: response regulator [Candidatus Ozemobacteraceae bacterium]|nr:response regulator [Candidatus Ozemobacteraceae bacterium]
MSKILIIEDDDQIRKMLRQMLERGGYEVFDAPNGKDGNRAFRKNPVDLIITDIFMPEMDGLETIIELRRDFPQLKIIAISGGARGGSFDFLPIAESFGAAKILKKPFTREEILNAVKEVLEAKA